MSCFSVEHVQPDSKSHHQLFCGSNSAHPNPTQLIQLQLSSSLLQLSSLMPLEWMASSNQMAVIILNAAVHVLHKDIRCIFSGSTQGQLSL